MISTTSFKLVFPRYLKVNNCNSFLKTVSKTDANSFRCTSLIVFFVRNFRKECAWPDTWIFQPKFMKSWLHFVILILIGFLWCTIYGVGTLSTPVPLNGALDWLEHTTILQGYKKCALLHVGWFKCGCQDLWRHFGVAKLKICKNQASSWIWILKGFTLTLCRHSFNLATYLI